MKKSVELKQERQALKDAQTGLIEKAKNEKREFTPQEIEDFDKRHGEIEDFDKQIERAERAEALQLENAKRTATPVHTSIEDGEGKEKAKVMKRYSLHKAIRSQMGSVALDGPELEMHQEVVKRAKAAGKAIEGIGIPAPESRAAGQTVTEDSGDYGANLVPTETRGIIDMLRPKTILQEMGAQFLTGLTGDIEFPVNEGGIDAVWAGEVEDINNTKNKYGKREMKPKRLASSVLVSLQNLMQSSIDLEQYTATDINRVMSLALETAAINGTAPAPIGILNASGTNVIAAGTNGAAPSWEQIVAMETAIYSANADADRMGYIINAATKGKLKTTKHSAGDLNYLMSMAGEINGYRAGISNLLPNDLTKGTGTNLNAAIFGDFSELLMGQWGFYDLTVDKTSKKKAGMIEITVNQFLDVLVKQPKAFSVIKDWDLA